MDRVPHAVEVIIDQKADLALWVFQAPVFASSRLHGPLIVVAEWMLADLAFNGRRPHRLATDLNCAYPSSAQQR